MVYEGYRPLSDWLTQHDDYFIVKYHPEYSDDVDECVSCANWVREKTQRKYPHDISMRITITLCRDIYEITNLSGGRSSGNSIVSLSRAEIYIIPPS